VFSTCSRHLCPRSIGFLFKCQNVPSFRPSGQASSSFRQTTCHNACLYTFCTELVSGARAGNAKMPIVNSPPDIHVVYMCGLNCTVLIFYGMHTVQCIAIYLTFINLIKRTVSRDFLLLVSFKVHHWYQRQRRQICHRYQRHRWQILPLVLLVLSICHRCQRYWRQQHRWQFATSINDNGSKFAIGVNDNSCK
jgi:hypothetical protein